jgi:hypothetical protein
VCRNFQHDNGDDDGDNDNDNDNDNDDGSDNDGQVSDNALGLRPAKRHLSFRDGRLRSPASFGQILLE